MSATEDERAEKRKIRSVWHDMRKRCLNPLDKAYPNYGGRGIKICARWDSFDKFHEDMGPRPAGYRIDRINNDDDYKPSNCEWVSPRRSTENRRCSIMVPDGTEGKLVLSAYCRKYNLHYPSILSRLRIGVPLLRAIDPAPIGKPGRLSSNDYDEIRRLVDEGQRTQKEIAQMFGVHPSHVSRIVSGQKQKLEPIGSTRWQDRKISAENFRRK